MKAMTARVKSGRLVLDEPTNLPEGAVVSIEAVDGDDLDDEDRALLHAELAEAEAEAERGELVSEVEFWAQVDAAP
jgi:hypothetical protein